MPTLTLQARDSSSEPWATLASRTYADPSSYLTMRSELEAERFEWERNYPAFVTSLFRIHDSDSPEPLTGDFL